MRYFLPKWTALVLTGLVLANATSAPFSVQISSKSQAYKVGEQIRVDLTLRNTSNHQITVGRARGEAAAELSYSFDVRKANGLPDEETEYLSELTGKHKDPKHIVIFNSSFSQETLKPGETLQEHAVLTKLYVLEKPGVYRIQVSHAVPEELGGGTVKSNVFTITVTK